MRWSVTTPPTGTVLTWDQLKYHIVPGSVQQQPLIMDYLAEATAYAEQKMECCLLSQTITAVYDPIDLRAYGPYFPSIYGGLGYGSHRRGMLLPRGPVQSVSSVTDANNNPVTYIWHTVGNADLIEPMQAITPTQAPITIIFLAGFSTVPADIKGMIRVHTATKYKYREDVDNLPVNMVHRMDDFYRYRGRGWFIA